MRAIGQTRFGGPEVLELVEVPRPAPLATEVLVGVRATSVNPVELFIRSGAFPLLGQPPFTLGWDVSGVVEEVVPGTSRFAVGDEVYGMPLFPRAANAYAEYVASPSRQLARKPSNLSHAEAAALPLVALTAYQALIDVAHVQPGQRVLIHAAGGGVGHIAVQIAKLLGAEVIGTASAAKADFVRGLGADRVIDYRAADFAQAITGVDVVLELVGNGYAERSISVLRPGGLLVTAVERTNAELGRKFEAAGRRFAGVAVEPDYPALERIAGWVEAGKVRPHVAQVLPLAQAAEAHRLVATGATAGKVVLATR
jgi:NADPH:quinone reductase-like Zn-dependent oxidoreductase